MASNREELFSSFAEYQRKRQCQHDVSNLDRVLSSKRLKGGLRSSQSSECSTQPAKLVTMSRIDKASTIHLSDCLTKVTSWKGYRLARATHGVSEGCWYYEVRVEYLGPSGHCRIGWATKQAHLHAPVGFDEHGYSYRDIGGTKQHKAEREDYGSPYGAGDVIGCAIFIPEDRSEIMEDEAPPKSFIAFSKNGQLQGIAFEDIIKGQYFPALSMFTSPEQERGVTLSVNFGPDFIHDPVMIHGAEPKGMVDILFTALNKEQGALGKPPFPDPGLI